MALLRIKMTSLEAGINKNLEEEISSKNHFKNRTRKFIIISILCLAVIAVFSVFYLNLMHNRNKVPAQENRSESKKLQNQLIYFEMNSNIYSIDMKGKNLRQIQFDEEVMLTGASCDGQWISYHEWNIETKEAKNGIMDNTGKVVKILSKDSEFVCIRAFSPDGKLIAVTDNGTAKILDLSGTQVSRDILVNADESEWKCNGIQFTSDGKKMLYTGNYLEERKHWLVDIKSGEILNEIGEGVNMKMHFSLSPDDKKIFYTDDENNLWISNLDGSSRSNLAIQKIGSHKFLQDGKRILAVKEDKNHHGGELYTLMIYTLNEENTGFTDCGKELYSSENLIWFL